MRVETIVVGLVALAAAGLGFFVGRASVASASVELAPAAPPARTHPAPPPAASGLVCAALGRPSSRADDDDEQECEAAALRTRWCEGQLRECTAQREAVRQPWPMEGIEEPEAWSEAIEEAMAECDIGAELEVIDCTEYPCVAALRPADPTLDDPSREEEMKRLMAASRGCAPLRRSLGLGPGDEDDEAIDVFRNDARCGEHREPFFVLSALDPKGPARDLIEQEHRSEQEERDIFRWLFRRADDVSAMWPCQ